MTYYLQNCVAGNGRSDKYHCSTECPEPGLPHSTATGGYYSDTEHNFPSHTGQYTEPSHILDLGKVMNLLDEANKLLRPPLSESEENLNRGVTIVKMLKEKINDISAMPAANHLIKCLRAAEGKIYINNFAKIFNEFRMARMKSGDYNVLSETMQKYKNKCIKNRDLLFVLRKDQELKWKKNTCKCWGRSLTLLQDKENISDSDLDDLLSLKQTAYNIPCKDTRIRCKQCLIRIFRRVVNNHKHEGLNPTKLSALAEWARELINKDNIQGVETDLNKELISSVQGWDKQWYDAVNIDNAACNFDTLSISEDGANRKKRSRICDNAATGQSKRPRWHDVSDFHPYPSESGRSTHQPTDKVPMITGGWYEVPAGPGLSVQRMVMPGSRTAGIMQDYPSPWLPMHLATGTTHALPFNPVNPPIPPTPLQVTAGILEAPDVGFQSTSPYFYEMPDPLILYSSISDRSVADMTARSNLESGFSEIDKIINGLYERLQGDIRFFLVNKSEIFAIKKLMQDNILPWLRRLCPDDQTYLALGNGLERLTSILDTGEFHRLFMNIIGKHVNRGDCSEAVSLSDVQQWFYHIRQTLGLELPAYK